MNNDNTIEELTKSMVKNTNSRYFNIYSANTNKYLDNKIEEITDHISTISSYLSNDSKPVNENGNTIVNFDKNREWFHDNISFIIATGKIFQVDDVDNKNMIGIMNSFHPEGNKAYLDNPRIVGNYNDVVIQSFEKDIGIRNGNYHILFIVMNTGTTDFPTYAEGETDRLPIEFDNIGIVKYSTKWNEINQIMQEYLIKYGLIYETFNVPKIDFKKQQRIQRDNYFDPNPSLSVTDVYFSRIDDLPKGKAEYFKFDQKQNMRVSKPFMQDQRGDRKDVSDPRLQKRNDLYSRIRNDLNQSLPTRMNGGVSKMDLYQLPEEAKTAEFVIYGNPNNGTYNIPQGVNLFGDTNPTIKSSMPNLSPTFSLSSTRNAKGERKMKILDSSPLFPGEKK